MKPNKKLAAVMLSVITINVTAPTVKIVQADGFSPIMSSSSVPMTQAEESNALANGKSTEVVEKMQDDSSVMTLNLFPTSPFKDGSIGQQQSFEMLQRDLDVGKNYALFTQAAAKVLSVSGLCAGSGSVEARLQSCANDRPDQFATVSNMMRSYFDWQNAETRTIAMYYQNKIFSPLLRDRIEARLVQDCLRRSLAQGDSMAAYNICRDPQNWDVTNAFYGSCSASASSASGTFQYKKYLNDCVISNVVKKSLGSMLVHEILPDFKIAVTSAGVEITAMPMNSTPQNAYNAIYELVYSELSSEWFNKMTTNGCLPSIFAPVDFNADPSKRGNYYSLCLPKNIVEQLSSLPTINASHFRSIIAKRIAHLQTVEMLNGASLITQTAQASLMAADRELGALVESYPVITSKYTQAYLDQIDLTFAKKLDDVLEEILKLFDSYNKDITGFSRASVKISNDLAEFKDSRDKGI